jgi:hypothetical protein
MRSDAAFDPETIDSIVSAAIFQASNVRLLEIVSASSRPIPGAHGDCILIDFRLNVPSSACDLSYFQVSSWPWKNHQPRRAMRVQQEGGRRVWRPERQTLHSLKMVDSRRRPWVQRSLGKRRPTAMVALKQLDGVIFIEPPGRRGPLEERKPQRSPASVKAKQNPQ